MIRIGIDCGVNTGFARSFNGELMEVKTYEINEAMRDLLFYCKNGQNPDGVKIYIEDARQRKWIPTERNARQVVGRAKGAGSVCRDAQIWQGFCELYGFEYRMVAPKNNKTKLTAEQFKRLTGWQGRTNEHGRDAAMLIWQRG
jgi:hypothetical protein